jgi:hypothetical protein
MRLVLISSSTGAGNSSVGLNLPKTIYDHLIKEVPCQCWRSPIRMLSIILLI